MTEVEAPAGPYWRTLLAGRRVPKLDLGPLIQKTFQTTAAQILCRDFRLSLGADGRPDTTSLSPERFEAELGALVGRFTLAYIDTIRDLFVEHLRDALGGEAAEPEGSDEWQVGELNVYPEEGWQLAVIAEELHDALLPFGPLDGAFRLEVGTIAGRVWSALTDDLGITMTHPAYREGVFDPDMFARNMEAQFIDTATFSTLTTLMAGLQKIAEAAEGEARLAKAAWPQRPAGPRPFVATPWTKKAPSGPEPAFAEAGLGPETSAGGSGDSERPTSSPKQAPTTPTPPSATPAPAGADLQHFLGRLFGASAPSEADDDPE